MAEKIKASDLIDKDVLAELLKVEKAIKGVTKSTAELMAVMQKQNEVLKKGADNQKTVADNVKKNEDNTRKLSDVEKEIQKIEEKHYQVLTKMVAARSEEARELEKANKQAKVEELQRKASIATAEGLRAKNQLLRMERDKLILTDKSYEETVKKLNKEIDKNDKLINKAKDSEQQRVGGIGKYKAVWDGLIGTFGKVVGGLAAVGITFDGFKKVLASSHTLMAKYHEIMTGMEFATKSFYSTIRSGDWGNLFSNMEKAYERGKQYEDMLDTINQRARSIGFEQTKIRTETAKLEEDLKNKGLTNKERLDKAQQWLDKTAEGYNHLIENAQKLSETELIALNLKVKNVKLSEDEIEQMGLKTQEEIQKAERQRYLLGAKQIMENYLLEDAKNKELREDAKKFNDLLKQKQSDIDNTIAAFRGGTEEYTKTWQKQLDEKKKDLDVLKSREDDVANFAAILRQVEGEKGDTRVQATIDAMNKELDAMSALWYENKRIINAINTLKKELAEDAERAKEKSLRAFSTPSGTDGQGEDFGKIWADTLENNKKVETENEKLTAKMNDDVKKYNEEKVKSEQEAQNKIDKADEDRHNKHLKRVELEKQIEDEIRSMKIASANAVFDIASGFMSREIQGLEEKKQKEIDSAGDNAKKKERIEAEYNKKIGAIKRKQAIAEKAQGIFNIGINTAIAIMKNNAQLGTALAAPINAWTRVLAALQIAAIMAQPIPKFFKGVRGFKGGLATVGDPNGQTKDSFELVETPKGSFLTPNKATEMLLPKGTNVYSHQETIEKLNNMHPSVANELLKEQKLTRKALTNQTHHSTTITAEGWRETTKKANSSITHIDKYFRF